MVRSSASWSRRGKFSIELTQKTVSDEAGHANVAFTLTRYGAVLDEMHTSASDKREGLLKSRAKN